VSTRIRYDRNWRGLGAHLQGVERHLQEQAEQIAEECAQMGQEIMQGMVDRIDTGHMKEQVKYQRGKGKVITAKYGWVEKPEDYFYYQDRGFEHNRSGKFIEGMHALFNSFVIVREEFKRRIEELTR
jgi:hypothetical protein